MSTLHRILTTCSTLLLALSLEACGSSTLVNLNDSANYYVLTESSQNSFTAETIETAQGFTPYYSIPDADKARSSAWLRMELPAFTTWVQPTLFLGLCLNVDKVYFDKQLLIDNKVYPNQHLTAARFKQAFVALPKTTSPQALYMHVVRSNRTLFQPDCREISLGYEKHVIRRFLNFQLTEMIVGLFMMVAGIVSCLAFLIKRQAIFIHFGLFTLSIGITFAMLTHPVLLLAWKSDHLIDLWQTAVMVVPTSFILFVQSIAQKPSLSLFIKRFSTLNFALILLTYAFYLAEKWDWLSSYREVYFTLVAAENIIIIPMLLKELFQNDRSPQRIVGLGLSIFVVSALFDIYAYLTDGRLYMVSCWGILALMGFLLVAIIRFFIQKSRDLEIEKRLNLEEYSLKLEQKVRSRTESLNEKTRQLEVSNHELEEKNILMRISAKNMEDIVNQKDTLLKQAADIKSKLGLTLQKNWQTLERDTNKTSVQAFSVEIHRLASQLEPFAKLYEDIQAISDKSIWLYEPEQRLLAMTKTALGGSKVKTRAFHEEESLLREMATIKPELIVISTVSSELPERIKQLSPKTEIILTSDKGLDQHISFLQAHSYLGHIVHHDEEDRIFTQRNLLVTSTKILSNDIFGLEKYLNWGVDVKEFIVTGSENRGQFIEQLEQDLSKAGVQSSMIRNAKLVTEELLMNCIYDAPHDRKTGLPKYNHLSRINNIELEPSDYGKLRYAFDGNFIAISVEDPFGALPRDVILKYVKSCFDGQFGKINEAEGKGGGGMGLFQILSTADLLITNIKPKQRTESLALINAQGKSQGKRRAGCFHYFVER